VLLGLAEPTGRGFRWIWCAHHGGASLRAAFVDGQAVAYAIVGPETQAEFEARQPADDAAMALALARRPGGAVDH
jgi:hypothetical protein